jgi:hypothetical protein
MLAFGVRLGRCMEEIQEHVSQRRDLGQQQLCRVCRTLPRGFQGQLPQPLGHGFPCAFGGGFYLGQFFRRNPGCNGFGTENRTRFATR